MEIAEFAKGMASDDLLENIRLIGIDQGHVVATTDELLTEITDLAKLGYAFAAGGGASHADVDLLAAFAAGRSGNLF